ncbi:MAG: DUF4115 domain-containing protein [Patescibacteria group bacterium]|nr:DUF4115 domain-containing protein [Patescibacteria group bacterium]
MKTVGEVLTEERRRKGVSLEEVEAATKIRKAVLEALEKGNYTKLPAPTYIKGLISNYGCYLGLNTVELQAIFRREYDERKNTPKTISSLKGIKRPLFILTPALIIAAFIILSVAGVSYYLYQQYNLFTAAPNLAVDEPTENFRTVNSAVSVVGYTYPEAVLKINGQPVQLSPGGNFVVSVDLPVGTNILTITSENKFGKISTVKRVVMVEQSPLAVSPTATSPASLVVPATASAQPDHLTVVLSIGPNSSWVSVTVDGENKYEGVLVNGVSKTFTGKERIKIKTGNAGSTKIAINGKDQVVMGKENEVLEKEYTK